MRPLCFVLMPFGRKWGGNWQSIDFDAIYRSIIMPAIAAADMEPIRADEEHIGGTIHKPMFERLMLCEYAIADVTGANPNVYYELGIRHALRPRSTAVLFASGTALPFDVALLRAIPYALNASGEPSNPTGDAAAIAGRLRSARSEHADDSPLFQLINDMPRVAVDHEKTDLFRERATFSRAYKNRLSRARSQGHAAVAAIAAEIEGHGLGDMEVGVLVDLYLAWRDIKAYQEMIDLHERMPHPLKRPRVVREQLAFALNRLGRHGDAEREALAVIADHGASSETNGILGRIYKDRWVLAREEGHDIQARGFLKRAIAAYIAGFEADWRDPYPGINAVTLMEMSDPRDERQSKVLPVVRYAAEQRTRSHGTYWDYATLLEIAALERDDEAAKEALASAAAAAHVSWEPETTLRNLQMIMQARERCGEPSEFLRRLVQQLDALAERMRASLDASPTS